MQLAPRSNHGRIRRKMDQFFLSKLKRKKTIFLKNLGRIWKIVVAFVPRVI